VAPSRSCHVGRGAPKQSTLFGPRHKAPRLDITYMKSVHYRTAGFLRRSTRSLRSLKEHGAPKAVRAPARALAQSRKRPMANSSGPRAADELKLHTSARAATGTLTQDVFPCVRRRHLVPRDSDPIRPRNCMLEAVREHLPSELRPEGGQTPVTFAAGAARLATSPSVTDR